MKVFRKVTNIPRKPLNMQKQFGVMTFKIIYFETNPRFLARQGNYGTKKTLCEDIWLETTDAIHLIQSII